MAQHLGRYEILGKLGEGAMGTVYKGHDMVIDRLVAIKTVRFPNQEDPELRGKAIARFYNEARITGRLMHSNITLIFDVGQEGDNHYIVMELINGITLDRCIKETRDFPLTQKVDFLAQISSALHYAHQRGVFHLDIKPANVMLVDSIAKIMDFGIAKMKGTFDTTTHREIVTGTPYYMSPEQITGKEVDSQSDIFSLGVTAYEWLTGKKPFRGSNLQELRKSILEKIPDPIFQLNPELPEGLDGIIRRMLAKNKADRYPFANQVSDDLLLFNSKMELKKSEEVKTPQNEPGVVRLLRKNYVFFSDLEEGEILELFKMSSRETYAKDKVVFQEGSVGHKMYVIISGSVKILQNKDGREYLVDTLGTGGCFGEMAILSDMPRSATIVAEKDCILIAIHEIILRHQNPKLALKLYKNLSASLVEKLRKSNDQIRELTVRLENTTRQ